VNKDREGRGQHEAEPEHHAILFDPEEKTAGCRKQRERIQRPILKKPKQFHRAGEIENGQGKVAISRAKAALTVGENHGNKKQQHRGTQRSHFTSREPHHSIEGQ